MSQPSQDASVLKVTRETIGPEEGVCGFPKIRGPSTDPQNKKDSYRMDTHKKDRQVIETLYGTIISYQANNSKPASYQPQRKAKPL